MFKDPGDQLSMHPFSGRPDQEWRFKDGRIVNPSTGLCLGMKGSAVVASKEDESNGQQWRIEYWELVSDRADYMHHRVDTSYTKTTYNLYAEKL